MKIIKKVFNLKNAEISIEANPKTLDEEKLSVLKASGVNFGGYKELKDKAKDADIIFNTVPQKVIDYEVLKNLDKDSQNFKHLLFLKFLLLFHNHYKVSFHYLLPYNHLFLFQELILNHLESF